jgi:hypothetical protein
MQSRDRNLKKEAGFLVWPVFFGQKFLALNQCCGSGSLYRIRIVSIPDPGSRLQGQKDPGSRVKKIPDPDSHQRI